MILDDVFSGLDAISEDRIFSRLLGKTGLLRRVGATVILVTHAAHRLSYADHIIALSAQGTVSEQGKFEELVANDGYVANLAARHMIEAENVPGEDVVPLNTKAGDDTARQNAAADLERPIGNWEIYKYYFSSAGWRNVGVWTILMVCYCLLLKFPGEHHPNVLMQCAKMERSLDQILDSQYCCPR